MKARASAASFHEAATLYQCFLDNSRDDSTGVGNEFGHGKFIFQDKCFIFHLTIN